MTLYALNLACPNAAQAESVAAELEPYADAVSYFELEDGATEWMVSAYFQALPDAASIRQAVATASGDDALADSASIGVLADKDWVAESQRLLPPVHAGGFIIHGSHDRETVPRSGRSIEIDAGAAFGTAHHGTTTGCLVAIDMLSREGSGCIAPANILDLGTGSAVLAIAAQRRWSSAQILASDIDPVAIAVAEDNAALNNTGAAIRFAVADGLDDDVIGARSPFDLIIANILAGPLIALAPDVCRALVTGGNARIVLSGLLDDQAEDVLEAYHARSFTASERISHNGWSTLILQHNSA